MSPASPTSSTFLNPLERHLLHFPHTPLILDGALATQLEQAHSLPLPSPLWSASALRTHPHAIHSVHRAYFAAGANVAITASYQATPETLARHYGVSVDEGTALIRLSVELAQSARSAHLASLPAHAPPHPPLLIAGSVGPYGALLADGSEYTGAYTLSDAAFRSAHRSRVAALLDAGADCLALETQPSVAEVRALCGLLAEEFPGARAWVSFTLRDAGRVSDGTALREAVELVEGCRQVVAVGVNCVERKVVGRAVREMARWTGRLGLVVYPNSGEEWDAVGRCWRSEAEEDGRGGSEVLGEAVEEWVRDGVGLLGLCCRSGPEDIRVLAEHARRVVDARDGERSGAPV